MIRPSRKTSRGAQRAGFTILEILVAAVLMVVIVGIVLGLTGSILRNWTQATAQFHRGGVTSAPWKHRWNAA